MTRKDMEVLKLLARRHGEWCFMFAGITRHTGFSRRQARASCRYLAARGFAKLQRGLVNEHTLKFVGSGYGSTPKGVMMVRRATA